MEAYDQRFPSDSEWGDLPDARFGACVFEGVDWSGKDLRGARFEECTFVACDLFNMRTLGLGLQDVTFRESKLVGFDFASCNALGFRVHMEDCIADAVNGEATDFRTATGWRIRPDENRIRGAKFRRDDLSGLVEGWDLDLS